MIKINTLKTLILISGLVCNGIALSSAAQSMSPFECAISQLVANRAISNETFIGQRIVSVSHNEAAFKALRSAQRQYRKMFDEERAVAKETMKFYGIKPAEVVPTKDIRYKKQ